MPNDRNRNRNTVVGPTEISIQYAFNQKLKIKELIYNFATLKELGWSTRSITYFFIVDVQHVPKEWDNGWSPHLLHPRTDLEGNNP